MKYPLVCLILLPALLLAISCSPTGTVQERPEEQTSTAPDREEEVSDRMDESGQGEVVASRLREDRSELRDQFVGLSHDMPAFYDRVQEQQNDPTQGFRVQILSTRDVSMADTTRREYEMWIEESRLDARPHSYIDYRQPTYRVRVGDFHNRDRAITFSQQLKRQFPAAWVVYSRVEPDRVPADSVRFEPLPN